MEKNHSEDFNEISERGERLEALIRLSNDMRSKESRMPVPYNDFLYMATNNPELVFRDIFQLFYSMVNYYIGKGVEEYPDSEDNIGFIGYDCRNLFVVDCDNPFFADRLFANRLMNLVDGFKQGSYRNHMILFEGPPGSGKSTFLNNILLKLEQFTRTKKGTLYKTYWCLDVKKLGGYREFEKTLGKFTGQIDGNLIENEIRKQEFLSPVNYKSHIDFSCPKHDHPILQIPKDYRENFLDELISDEEFKEKLFTKKEYEWVLKDIPCSICKSLYSSLLDELGDPMEVYSMIKARKIQFNRQFGEGVSVFNPGDRIIARPILNQNLQTTINKLFNTDKLDFIYSSLAKTNNGVLALMDIKENNIERLRSLHGLISDGVHKVNLIEEQIKSIFFGLVNPEDKVHFENVKSFQDRIITVNIPYILDFNTEVEIYKNKFGENIENKFLPRVLNNFAKIIISSRLDINTPSIKKWISNSDKYSKYLDKNLLLLKMSIYTGIIPDWISDDDIKKFDKKVRKAILSDSESEGRKGFSGRMSINIFNNFISKYGRNHELITMDMVRHFFTEKNKDLYSEIPEGFIDSLVDMYDYNLLQEVKESIYYYNEDQISRDIINYLWCINFELNTTETCEYTGDKIDIDEEYFKNFEAIFVGTTSLAKDRLTFRNENQREYISRTLATEIKVEEKNIKQTAQFRRLFEKYSKTLKENALAPYQGNENFRRAIKDYGSDLFHKYDHRMKRDVSLLMSNLQSKFAYSQDGAGQVSLYVLDKELTKKYL